ncbi:MAG TPA: hypothetical protein ENJ32_10205 [Crenotrichaceae bacterium]|nr:hypothetical protein [Crenotrichaceae bacterium]
MHESFFRYQNFFWLKVAIALSAVSIALYAWHTPSVVANGGTWLGYTLGTVAAVLIVWLAWFGARKRDYSSSSSKISGWLSAHVYLGLALIVVATLHTGFQFGWNVHTLAYGLMIVVIVSGMYGIYLYAMLPGRLASNRQGMTREQMLDEIRDLDETALGLADQIDSRVHEVILRSVEKPGVMLSFWQQLTAGKLGKDPLDSAERFLRGYQNDLVDATLFLDAQPQSGAQATMMYISNVMAGMEAEKVDKLRALMETVGRKKSLLKRTRRDVQLKALLQLWLFFHVPVSMALLAALLIHIISVFLYW